MAFATEPDTQFALEVTCLSDTFASFVTGLHSGQCSIRESSEIGASAGKSQRSSDLASRILLYNITWDNEMNLAQSHSNGHTAKERRRHARVF